MVEHTAENRGVASSILALGTSFSDTEPALLKRAGSLFWPVVLAADQSQGRSKPAISAISAIITRATQVGCAYGRGWQRLPKNGLNCRISAPLTSPLPFKSNRLTGSTPRPGTFTGGFDVGCPKTVL